VLQPRLFLAWPRKFAYGEQNLIVSMMDVQSDWLLTAMQYHRTGEFESADRLYRQILRFDPQHADALHMRGVLAFEQRDLDRAVDYFSQAVAVNASDARLHEHLGSALLEIGRLEEAAVSLGRSFDLDPHNADALFNLAIVNERRGRLQDAQGGFEKITQRHPSFVPAHRGLARSLEAQGRGDEATAAYRCALNIQPQDVETLNQLACLLYRQGKLTEAAACFRNSLEVDPENINSWLNLGSAFVASRQLVEAQQCFERVTEIDRNNTDGWLNLSNVLKTQHRVGEAAVAYRQALGRLPPLPLADLWPATLCPPVFQNNTEIDAYRDGLLTDIQRMSAGNLQLDVAAFDATASTPPVNLQYQGRDDRRLLEAFAGIFRHCFPANIPPPTRKGRPRIGFVVTSGHEAIFLRSLGRVLDDLPAEKFELVVICPQTSAGFLRAGLKNEMIELLPIPYQFPQVVEAVRAARFDVLYHWETGTDVTNYFLPFCRLAPVQCTSCGNSGTSGIAQIDYFLSSHLYEPNGADDQYTEALLLIDGPCSVQRRVSLPSDSKCREDFGYTADQHIYLCAQKPQKIHPDFDPILTNILRRDCRGVLVLVEDEYRVAAELLRRRFQSSMADVAERIVFETRLEFSDYLGLLAAADVLLDPPHYGGGMTLYDTLSLNKPVVTLPMQSARSRYALGFYKQMGVSAPVASSPEEYVDIAVRLATETDFRHAVEGEIGRASPVVFEDNNVVAEYEQIFERLVTEARSR
jgi:predicted O-linked N-acetylglucosamine transferase (SPINDLY family)